MSNSAQHRMITSQLSNMGTRPFVFSAHAALCLALFVSAGSSAAQTQRFDLTLGVERTTSSAYYDGPQFVPLGSSAGVRRLALQAQPRLWLSSDLRLTGALAITAGGYFGQGTVSDRYCSSEDFLCNPPHDRDVSNIGMELGLALTMPWEPLGALKLRGGAAREQVRVGKVGTQYGEEKFPMSGIFVGASFRRAVAGPVYLELGAEYRRLSVDTDKIAKAQQEFCGFCSREYEDNTARSTSLRLGAGASW